MISPTATPDKNSAITAPLSPGSLLRNQRIENGWTMPDVAQALRLSNAQLQALENDDYENLPGETYILGYWRNYANLLKISIGESIEVHKKFLRNTASGGVPNAHPRWLRSRADPSIHKFGILFALLSVVFLLGVWYWQIPSAESVLTQEQWQTDEIGDVGDIYARSEMGADILPPEAWTDALENPSEGGEEFGDSEYVQNAQDAHVIALESPAEAENRQTTEITNITDNQPLPAQSIDRQDIGAINSANQIDFAVSAESWLEVYDYVGKRLINRTVAGGQRLTLEGTPPFKVFIGNAEGVAVRYLGAPVAPLRGGDLFARFTLGVQ